MRGKFDAFGRNFFALKKSKMQDQGLFAYMQEDICRIVKSEKVADFRFHIMVRFFSMNLTDSPDSDCEQSQKYFFFKLPKNK